MARIRTTRDEWHLETNYGYGWESECVEESRREALARLKEYRQNTNASVRIVRRRVWVGVKVSQVTLRRPVSAYWHPLVYVAFARDGEGQEADGRLTGTALALADTPADDNVSLLVLLDRLEECPEEVEGLDAETVRAAVEWLRAHPAH